ncbi:MAG: RcpC/CpaB family pilus assembly protein [Actinomycetota bacterium]|nr:RcpC/CpaB family pilus assembly protein [Actinomycetota bacterium]
MDVPVARRLSKPAWVNLRSALGLLLFCAAFAGAQRVLSEARATTLVWAAARDLPANSTLSSSDLEPVAVKLPSSLLSRYASAATVVVGELTTRSLRRGELLPSLSLAPAGSVKGISSISIPVSPEHAVGGALRPGDRVDVYATFDAADIRARTTSILRNAEVSDVIEASGLVVGGEAAVGIVVSTSPSRAAAIAFALRTGEIDVVRTVGPSDGPSTITIRASDFK